MQTFKTINSKTRTTEEFIIDARKEHGDKYNYDKTHYKAAKQHVIITCYKHGDFSIKPDYHLQGGACLKCNARKPWSKVSMEWLKYIQETEAPNLEHYENTGKEHRIKNSKFKADGYDPDKNCIYEFHGCFWHGCPCKNRPLDEDDAKMLEERYNKTLEREKFIREQGYNLIVIWECEWNKKKF